MTKENKQGEAKQNINGQTDLFDPNSRRAQGNFSYWGFPFPRCFDNSSESKLDNTQTPKKMISLDRAKKRIKTEVWELGEIRKIFRLYDEHGSQWKLMEPDFSDRMANSIKNRFYTVVRTLLKVLFREHSGIVDKLPHQIPSKTVFQFFEGRQQFSRFKGLGKKILRMVDYDLESPSFRVLVNQNYQDIACVYELVFGIKAKGKKQVPENKWANFAYPTTEACQAKNAMVNLGEAHQNQEGLINAGASLESSFVFGEAQTFLLTMSNYSDLFRYCNTYNNYGAVLVYPCNGYF